MLSVFLALTAAATALSYALPQVPAQIRANPISYGQWLSAVQIRFRDWTSLLDAAGAFHVLEAAWFRGLLGFVVFILLVGVGNDAGVVLSRARCQEPGERHDGAEVTVMRSALPPQQAAHHVQQAMDALFHRVAKQSSGDVVCLVGRYGIWPPVGSLILRLGLVSLICALTVNARWGWTEPALSVLPGEPALVGPQSAHQVELLSIATSGDEAQIRTGGGKQFLLKAGETLYWHGYRYRWAAGSNPVVEISATDGRGQAIALSDYSVQPSPVDSLRFTFATASSASQEEGDHLFIVPEERMVVRVKWLRPGTSELQQPTQFHLWVFQSDGQTVVGDRSLAADTETTVTQIGGVRFVLRFSRSIVLSVSYQPGAWLLFVGGALVVLGSMIGLMPRGWMRAVIETSRGTVSVRIEERIAGLSWGYRHRRSELMAWLRTQLGEA